MSCPNSLRITFPSPSTLRCVLLCNADKVPRKFIHIYQRRSATSSTTATKKTTQAKFFDLWDVKEIINNSFILSSTTIKGVGNLFGLVWQTRKTKKKTSRSMEECFYTNFSPHFLTSSLFTLPRLLSFIRYLLYYKAWQGEIPELNNWIINIVITIIHIFSGIKNWESKVVPQTFTTLLTFVSEQILQHREKRGFVIVTYFLGANVSRASV